jgi:hypothetical protein
VFGSATVVRLSHDRTGLALATGGAGGVCMSGRAAWPRPGAPPPPGWPWVWPAFGARPTIDADRSSVGIARIMIVL